MKAGIAIALLAARILIETDRLPSHRIAMIWTTDEEIGSAHVRGDHRGRGAPEPGRVRARARARRRRREDRAERRRRFPDRSAAGSPRTRASSPSKGASAIHELAWQAAQLLALADPSRGLTINVGRIGGGTRPQRRRGRSGDGCRCQDSDRWRTPSGSRRHHSLAAGPARASARERWSQSSADGANARRCGTLRARRALARELGVELPEGATGGGSDGNFTAALGVPTLDGLGADGAGAHALDEHILIDSVPFRAALLAGLVAPGLVAPASQPDTPRQRRRASSALSPRNWNGARRHRPSSRDRATVTRVRTTGFRCFRHVAATQRARGLDLALLRAGGKGSRGRLRHRPRQDG